MPPINRQFDMVHSDEWSMKVAFASSDYRHVDQHFGATPRLVVYGVKADRVTLIRVVDFSVENGHQTEKIAADPRPGGLRHAVLRGDWRRGFSPAVAGGRARRTRSRRHHHRRLTAGNPALLVRQRATQKYAPARPGALYPSAAGAGVAWGSGPAPLAVSFL